MAALLAAFLSLCVLRVHSADCPCDDTALCAPISTPLPDKELFGFLGGDAPKYLPYMNWTHITAVAIGSTADAMLEVMCEAHRHNVRVIYWSPTPPLTTNETERKEWIESMYEFVSSLYLDGLTFDLEMPMNRTNPKRDLYTTIVNETTLHFHNNEPYSQISVCVAWATYNIDQRNYDYLGLSQSSDFLYLMDYDTRSQILDSCLAAANSAFTTAYIGLTSYLESGIAAEKLVLGVPFYGYNYTCDMGAMESQQSKYCPLPLIPFRGINCSDAAGREISYAKIMAQIIDESLNITAVRWDANMASPFFNYEWPDSHSAKQVYQMWFDDPQSLSLKYGLAKSMNIRGIGPYTFTQLYYTLSAKELKRAQLMWTAFDSFFV